MNNYKMETKDGVKIKPGLKLYQWLPTLSRYTLESGEVTDQFDFRWHDGGITEVGTGVPLYEEPWQVFYACKEKALLDKKATQTR